MSVVSAQVWHCPACRRPNDKLRVTCRACHAHRPCEHYSHGRRCGATPVRNYPTGPKCAAHTPPGAPPSTPGRPPPVRVPAGERLWTASRLGIPVLQVGRCPRCGEHHQRYGPGGNPLCPKCLANRP